MAFNVDEIIQSINASGVLKASKFEMVISGTDGADLLTVRCIAAQIPGITINTTDFKLYGGMPVLKVPSSRTYSDLRLTFLARSDSADRYFFDNWFNQISNFSSNTVAYYNDVARDITINVYDEFDPTKTFNVQSGLQGVNTGTGSNQGTTKDNIAYSVKVLNAIPISLDEVDISWADSDKLLEYTVTFSYEQLQLTNNTIMI